MNENKEQIIRIACKVLNIHEEPILKNSQSIYECTYDEIIKISEEFYDSRKNEFEDKLQKCYTEIWQNMVYPISTKGLPKADDILKREFPFLKV